MKLEKALLKIIGLVLIVIGAGLAIYGGWESICKGVKKLFTCPKCKDETKDYEDCFFGC